MKIITLNTWGGRAGSDVLLEFFDRQKDDIDVFCLQEMWRAPYSEYDGHTVGGLTINQDNVMTKGVQEISGRLPQFEGYFRPHFMEDYGLMMFLNKKYKIIKEGEIFVYLCRGHVPDGDIGSHARNIQYITLMHDDKELTIINFHGLWNGKGKTDTDDRLKQSDNIIDFIKTLNGNVVLCGDFNLLPDTESIKKFEDIGLVNLVKEHNVLSTRTSFYTKPEKFADYIFVDKAILVKDFKVLSDEVSDHAPLYIEV